MSDELLATMVGAILGGFLTFVGGLGLTRIQEWRLKRGEIKCEIVDWSLTFIPPTAWTDRYGEVPYAEAKESDRPPLWWRSANFSFTTNWMNEKGVNVALMRYWVTFLQGREPLLEQNPRGRKAEEAIIRLPSEAIGLSAESVAAISLSGSIGEKTDIAKVLQADTVEFSAHLSTGEMIRKEIARLQA